MNNIEWEDGLVCFASGKQFVDYKNRLASAVDGGLYSHSEILSKSDFQLNEPRIGDYIEKSELDTEQKYNDVVEVFGLFGFEYQNSACCSFLGLQKYGVLVICPDYIYAAKNHKEWCKRKLTYNQIMAIGKLKRMMNEREAGESDIKKVIDKTRSELSGDGEKGRFIIGESDEGLEYAIPDSARKNADDNIEITFKTSVNLEQDFKKHIRDIENDIYNAVNKSAPKTTKSVSTDKKHKTSKQYLSECIEVQKQRGEQYDSNGTGERSFDAAAKAFNALTGKELKGSDVCLLLTCVKAVRQYSNSNRLHEDSLLDLVSYASLWAEELNKELPSD
jgi:hypothetical protein